MKVVLYSHLFQNFPVCCDQHSQRFLCSQSHRSRWFFWNSLVFSMIQRMLAIWSLVPLPFLNLACASGSSQFTYCWNLDWRITALLACELKATVQSFKHSLALPFLCDWNENWPFPVLWPLLSVPICWHIQCGTLTGSSLGILNSSAGIPSPLLALFIVMLPKTHLTSHSRMSSSRWMTTPLWFSCLLRPFLY